MRYLMYLVFKSIVVLVVVGHASFSFFKVSSPVPVWSCLMP